MQDLGDICILLEGQVKHPKASKVALAPLIRKLSWCPVVQYLSETWSIPHLPEAQAEKLSHFVCLTLPAYFAAGTYCAGVFIIFTLLVMSCFGLLPDLHFSPFLRVADRLSGINFHRFLVPSARRWTHLTQLCAYTVQMSASRARCLASLYRQCTK